MKKIGKILRVLFSPVDQGKILVMDPDPHDDRATPSARSGNLSVKEQTKLSKLNPAVEWQL